MCSMQEGTKRMLEILERITAGEGRAEDLDRLESLAEIITSGSLCGLGQTAANPVISTLKYFRDEYEAHIYDKRCPAGACHTVRVLHYRQMYRMYQVCQKLSCFSHKG